MTSSTAHRLTENVKLLQKVIIICAGKILLLRRSSESSSRPLLWDLPGGNAEWPTATENIQNPHTKDVTREVFEETGIELLPETLRQSVYVGSYFEAERQMYTLIIGWKVKVSQEFQPQDVLLSDEHTEFVWVEKADALKYDFGFAGENKGFIRQMILNACVE